MEAQQKAYEEFFTTCITKAPGLKYFDVNEVVIVSVDASSEGLGAYFAAREPARSLCIKITE